MTIYGVRAMVVRKVFFMRAFFKYFNVILFIIGVLETTEKIHKQLKLFFLKTPFVLLVFLTALRIYF